jgi:hypothetical protein
LDMIRSITRCVASLVIDPRLNEMVTTVVTPLVVSTSIPPVSSSCKLDVRYSRVNGDDARDSYL